MSKLAAQYMLYNPDSPEQTADVNYNLMHVNNYHQPCRVCVALSENREALLRAGLQLNPYRNTVEMCLYYESIRKR